MQNNTLKDSTTYNHQQKCSNLEVFTNVKVGQNKSTIDSNGNLTCQTLKANSLSGGGSTFAEIDNNGSLIRSISSPPVVGFGFANVLAVPDITTGITTPAITVPLGSKAEGTWAKITGLNASGSENGCTIVGSTFTVTKAGVWRFSMNIAGLKDSGTGKRFVFVSIQKNVSDADQVLATYSPAFSVTTFQKTNDLYSMSASAVKTLAINDTIKFFIALTHAAGSGVSDVEIYAMDITCHLMY